MDRDIDVRTPESIAFRYDLAGLGSRFLAVVVDMMIQIVLVILIIWGLASLGSGAKHDTFMPVQRVDAWAMSIAYAFIYILIFMIFYGYFILFEAFWNGQTPGKKLLGIRVVRDGGYPVDFGAAFLRNLIRIAEMILGFYATSIVATLMSNENKRIGDYVAGTIVVRDAKLAKPLTFRDAIAAGVRSGSGAYITDEERTLIDRYLARRSGMEYHVRVRLASEIAQRVRGRAPAALQSLSDAELLEQI